LLVYGRARIRQDHISLVHPYVPFQYGLSCPVPRRHAFVSPHGVGIKLGRLLKDPERFKEEARSVWVTHCVPPIGSEVVAPLEGDFEEYFDNFDFSIFGDCSPVELIEEHMQTGFYASRFGGGLPPRDEAQIPPSDPTEDESLYLRKLFDAYEDHLGETATIEDLNTRSDLRRHYDRQRELFYSAESLRNFARDRTPPRTFDSLQEDVYNGVIDVCEADYADALERLRSTITAAGSLDVSGNDLVSVTRVADKQGVCHQLANDDRLTWKDDHDR